MTVDIDRSNEYVAEAIEGVDEGSSPALEQAIERHLSISGTSLRWGELPLMRAEGFVVAHSTFSWDSAESSPWGDRALMPRFGFVDDTGGDLFPHRRAWLAGDSGGDLVAVFSGTDLGLVATRLPADV